MTTADDATIGVTGKAVGRVDFNLKRFVDMIERSPRFVWERAMFCPCPSVNDQTQQPDPNCTKCKGVGWLWFGPAGYVVPPEAGTLTPVQKAVVDRNGGAVICAFMAEATYRQAGYDTLGTWAFGQMHVTVRPENKLGYYDRLINLDSEIVFSQRVLSGGEGKLSLRYPAINVANVQSSTATYLEGRDFEVVGGDIIWLSGRAPASGTQLAAHYTCHPAWIVTSYPHVIRATTNDRKPKKPVVSPEGNPQNLPIRARVQLEFEREG
jgi:hypothetical protein|tara:strand:+ start:5898 stop:6695 length:798 start_codon:yes stop_codon:yes gene_type:complete